MPGGSRIRSSRRMPLTCVEVFTKLLTVRSVGLWTSRSHLCPPSLRDVENKFRPVGDDGMADENSSAFIFVAQHRVGRVPLNGKNSRLGPSRPAVGTRRSTGHSGRAPHSPRLPGSAAMPRTLPRKQPFRRGRQRQGRIADPRTRPTWALTL